MSEQKPELDSYRAQLADEIAILSGVSGTTAEDKTLMATARARLGDLRVYLANLRRNASEAEDPELSDYTWAIEKYVNEIEAALASGSQAKCPKCGELAERDANGRDFCRECYPAAIQPGGKLKGVDVHHALAETAGENFGITRYNRIAEILNATLAALTSGPQHIGGDRTITLLTDSEWREAIKELRKRITEILDQCYGKDLWGTRKTVIGMLIDAAVKNLTEYEPDDSAPPSPAPSGLPQNETASGDGSESAGLREKLRERVFRAISNHCSHASLYRLQHDCPDCNLILNDVMEILLGSWCRARSRDKASAIVNMWVDEEIPVEEQRARLIEDITDALNAALAPAISRPPTQGPIVCDVCKAIFVLSDDREHLCGLTLPEAYALGWRRGNNLPAQTLSNTLEKREPR